jgi:hypothetical protein
LALSLTNASAILWRLETLGYHIGDRWRDLAALWEGHADGKCLVFTDIHAAMAELGSGQEAAVERRLAAMRETAASGAEASDLYRTVGIPVVAGLAAFHRGAYDRAVELLLQVRFDLWQIGGSHAQRDVVNWTLTEAAIRAGQRDVALSFARMNVWGLVRAAPSTSAFSGLPRTSRGGSCAPRTQAPSHLSERVAAVADPFRERSNKARPLGRDHAARQLFHEAAGHRDHRGLVALIPAGHPLPT